MNEHRKKPTKEEYAEARLRDLLNWAPRIYPCEKCGWPVFDGYLCNYCGHDDSK